MNWILDWLRRWLNPPVPTPNGADLLTLHNSVRPRPLVLDAALSAYAQSYAERMRTLRHSGGPYAENIAEAPGSFNTPARVFAMWYGDPPHRANITNPNYTHVGFGHTGDFWVAEYA